MTMYIGEHAHADAMRGVLAHNWWALALRGVAGIVFGVVALLLPGAAMLSLVLVFGRHERWVLLVLEGFAGLIAAAVALLLPGITVLVFVALVAAWAVISGGLAFGAAFQLDAAHGRWWMLLGGAASVIFGIMLVVAPLIGAVVLTWWIGAYAFVFGVSFLILGFKLRTHRHEHPHGAMAAGA